MTKTKKKLKLTRYTMRCSDADLARIDEVGELLHQLGEADDGGTRADNIREATRIAIRSLRARVAAEKGEVLP